MSLKKLNDQDEEDRMALVGAIAGTAIVLLVLAAVAAIFLLI